MNGFKSQQHRWTKGVDPDGAQAPSGASSASAYPWKVKLEAFFHLTNNISYLLVVILALLIVPAIIIRERIGWQRLAIVDFPLFFGATFSFIAFYISSQREIGRGWKPTLRLHAVSDVARHRAVAQQPPRGARSALRPASRSSRERRSTGSRAARGEWRTKKYRAAGNYSLVGEILLAGLFPRRDRLRRRRELLGRRSVSARLLQRVRLHGSAVDVLAGRADLRSRSASGAQPAPQRAAASSPRRERDGGGANPASRRGRNSSMASRSRLRHDRRSGASGGAPDVPRAGRSTSARPGCAARFDTDPAGLGGGQPASENRWRPPRGSAGRPSRAAPRRSSSKGALRCSGGAAPAAERRRRRRPRAVAPAGTLFRRRVSLAVEGMHCASCVSDDRDRARRACRESATLPST